MPGHEGAQDLFGDVERLVLQQRTGCQDFTDKLFLGGVQSSTGAQLRPEIEVPGQPLRFEPVTEWRLARAGRAD